ncbi:MAG: hypothetical protein EOO92_03045 [Pedobacter sp.]|nr:MAG: hypothetical protein EOO92_03045 [Pedobacter sp.]
MPIKPIKPSSNDELIVHIKKNLGGYEEEYVPGAWEKFNKKEGKQKGFIYRIGGLSSAAALLLLGFGLFMYRDTLNVTTPAEQYNKNQTINPNQHSNTQQSVENTKAENIESRMDKSLRYESYPRHRQESLAKDNTDFLTVVNDVFTESNSATNEDAQIPNQQKNAVAPNLQSNKAITLDEFLAIENKIDKEDIKPTSKTNTDKWAVGVVISPSFGNTHELNMGYGMSMDYKISDKISLSSGVSYNELAAAKNIIPDVNMQADYASNNALVAPSKSLQSVSARYVGIDIPFEIKYQLTDRFYANIGLSAFAVINQRQQNTYLQGRLEQRTVSNMSGDQQLQSYLIKENVTENNTSREENSNSLIGFYNFSFGYKQKISKDKSLGIEPFMKVPMKDVTKENLRLLGTGLKIKFDF